MFIHYISVNHFFAHHIFGHRIHGRFTHSRFAHHIMQFLAIVAIIIAAFCATETRVGHADDDEPETTEVVVKLADGATIDDVNKKYGTTTLEELLGSAAIYRLRVPAGQEADDVAELLEEDLRVLYAEPNFVGETPEGDGRYTTEWGGQDPTVQDTQYAAFMLRLADAHALRRGANTVVAVLDTGIQLNHPAFAATLTSVYYDFIDDDAIPEDVGNGQDDDNDGHIDEALGHGTHVAGVIHQVAPDAKIMPLRVLDADGSGNIFVIAEAILYAAKHGADVINLSLGSSAESDLMEDVIEDVFEDYNVVVVAAAGNLNSEEEQFPASESEVLAVTAIGAGSKKSEFANYGDWIDVVAPGEGIISAFPDDGYASWSGTSMATPFVAGQVALIRSAVPTITVPYIMAHIRLSAQSVDALNPGFETALGGGRIDIGGSLQAMCGTADSCHMPDLTGQVILEAQAKIDSHPAGQLTGTWVIGGVTYVANGETDFDADDDELLVGSCVKVEYRNTIPFTVLEIHDRDLQKCNNSATATPMATATPTIMPNATAVPSSNTVHLDLIYAPFVKR